MDQLDDGVMMRIVNVYEAKKHFFKLVDTVMHGNEIVIAKSRKPVAILRPINKKPQLRLGVLKGKIKISKDFDDSLSDNVLADFED